MARKGDNIFSVEVFCISDLCICNGRLVIVFNGIRDERFGFAATGWSNFGHGKSDGILSEKKIDVREIHI